MLYGNNIKIRILKSRLLYILVCVLSGDSDSFAGDFGRSIDQGLETVRLVVSHRGYSECL